MKRTISWRLLATVYWSRDEMEMDNQSFSAGDCPHVYYVPPLIRSRLYLVKDTATEKEVDIAI